MPRIIFQHRYNAYRYTQSITNAISYLQQKIIADKITDTYDLAVVTYALGLAGSPNGYAAYTKLNKMSITTSGMFYETFLHNMYFVFNLGDAMVALGSHSKFRMYI